MVGPDGVEWFQPREKIEAALLQALKSNDTWDGAALQVARSLGGTDGEIYDYPLDASYWDPRTLFEFAPAASPDVRTGLTVRVVGDHAFLLHLSGDWPSYDLTVRTWWTPADDYSQMERAILDRWVSHWREDGLPPMGGPLSRLLWKGPDEYRFAFDCLDALLEADDDAWDTFTGQLVETVAHLEEQVAGGVLLDTLGGSAPPPSHDLSWLASVVRGGKFDAARKDVAARRSLISYYLKPHSAPVSHWRRVIDGCSRRGQHLYEAAVARIAEHGECRLDFDDGLVGLDSVLRCLEHTFGMTPEDLEELRAEAESELDRYESGDSSRELSGQPRYPGGHPRIASGEHEGEFYSSFDICELVESRSEELAHISSWDSAARVEFGVDRPDDGVAAEGMMGEFQYEWSLPLDTRRLGDGGCWVMEYYNGNAEREIEAAIGAWAPFADDVARRVAFVDVFGSWWGQYEDYTMGAHTWQFFIHEPALVVDAIADLCARSDDWWDTVLTVDIERAADRSRLEEGLWVARGCELPVDSWWDSPSNDAANNRRHEVRFVRELAAFYEMHSLERLPDNDDNKASVEDAEA